MAKMHTPAMEKLEKKNARRKKTVNSTPLYESWKRFKRNPTALMGLAVVVILVLVAILAPLLALMITRCRITWLCCRNPVQSTCLAQIISDGTFSAAVSTAPDTACSSHSSVHWRQCSAEGFWESSPDISAGK